MCTTGPKYVFVYLYLHVFHVFACICFQNIGQSLASWQKSKQLQMGNRGDQIAFIGSSICSQFHSKKGAFVIQRRNKIYSKKVYEDKI